MIRNLDSTAMPGGLYAIDKPLGRWFSIVIVDVNVNVDVNDAADKAPFTFTSTSTFTVTNAETRSLDCGGCRGVYSQAAPR